MSSLSSITAGSAWSGLEALASRLRQSTSAGASSDDLFASVDSNGDGQLSSDEFNSALQSAGSAAAQCFDMSGLSTQAFAGMQASGLPPPPPGGGKDPMAQLDTDGDGSISADEFGLDGASTEVQNLFKAIDTDGDGALSASETDGFRESFMQRMGGVDRPPPSGPPPGAAQDGSGASDSTTAGGRTRSTDAQLQGFLQHLAEMFASQYASTAANDSTTQALSLSV